MASTISHLATGAAQAAHAEASALIAKHPAKAGDKLPLKENLKENDATKPIALAPTGRTVFVGVPGAFTPSCSSQAPAYIEKYEEFKSKGVNEIFIVTVNDSFVTKAWKEKLAPNGTPVRFLADDQALFVTDLGLLFDASPVLGGPRAKRFVLIANGDTIEQVIVENNPSEVTETAASHVLTLL